MHRVATIVSEPALEGDFKPQEPHRRTSEWGAGLRVALINSVRHFATTVSGVNALLRALLRVVPSCVLALMRRRAATDAGGLTGLRVIGGDAFHIGPDDTPNAQRLGQHNYLVRPNLARPQRNSWRFECDIETNGATIMKPLAIVFATEKTFTETSSILTVWTPVVRVVSPKCKNRAVRRVTFGLRSFSPIATQTLRGDCLDGCVPLVVGREAGV